MATPFSATPLGISDSSDRMSPAIPPWAASTTASVAAATNPAASASASSHSETLFPDGLATASQNPTFKPGSVARSLGLSTSPLNGVLGILKAFDQQKDRWQVCCYSGLDRQSATKLFKVGNLALVDRAVCHGDDDAQWPKDLYN